jgi:membrane protein
MADPRIEKVRKAIRRVPGLIGSEIWEASVLSERSLRGRLFAFLRMASITVQGVVRNKIPSQSAALSYFSLIALGPMVAIAIMVSSFILRSNETSVAQDTLQRILVFIAPPAAEMMKVEEDGGDDPQHRAISGQETGTTSGKHSDDDDSHNAFNPELVKLINHLVMSAQSGAVGIVGSLVLIVICIQLITSIENTFNTIWGVRRGRSWMQRIVLYWTVLSLGAVLGFAAVSLNTLAAIQRQFKNLPFDLDRVLNLDGWLSHLLPVVLVVVILTLFYRFIPNIHVRWGAAILGSAVVAIMLQVNNALSFLYIHRVIREQSLYGSIGIVPVLMFGIYIFWLFILLGGQLIYSIQNFNFLTNQRMWENLSPRLRKLASLAAFSLIARRFKECTQPPSAEDLAEALRIPGNLLNESLNRLQDARLINPVECLDSNHEKTVRFQPGLPLDKLTLGGFSQRLDESGNNEGRDLLLGLDELVHLFDEQLIKHASCDALGFDFDTLLSDSDPNDK